MPSQAVERVLSRLEGVRPNGDAWTARCKAHDDRQNSLSIREGEDGRVLLKCFAGCPVEAIVTALGLSMRDLFSDTGQTGSARPAKPKPPLSVAPVLRPLGDEARRWLDENGKSYSAETLARFQVQETAFRGERAIVVPAEGQVLRLYFFLRPDKGHRWQVWPTGAGGSIVKGDLDGKEMLVAEGEWDALKLYDAGFRNVLTGTTGAGSFPKAHQPLFEGKTALIAYDNDEPGRKGAEKLAGEIAEACPKAKVRIAEIPAGSWEGKDVSDYLNAGNTAEDFKEVLASARPYQTRVAIGFHFDTGAELLALKIEEPPHIVKTFLLEQGQTMIAAEGGVGKSLLSLELALVGSSKLEP